jgi:hypothetical protein
MLLQHNSHIFFPQTIKIIITNVLEMSGHEVDSSSNLMQLQ